MSVKTYSLVRDGEKQLTKDFRVREFRDVYKRQNLYRGGINGN